MSNLFGLRFVAVGTFREMLFPPPLVSFFKLPTGVVGLSVSSFLIFLTNDVN